MPTRYRRYSIQVLAEGQPEAVSICVCCSGDRTRTTSGELSTISSCTFRVVRRTSRIPAGSSHGCNSTPNDQNQSQRRCIEHIDQS